MRATLDAIRHLEDAVTGADWTEGIVLRYGGFYGPGTGIAARRRAGELIHKRKWPIVGDGGGVWSFVQIEDAAAATVEAIEHGERGVYNVVDDEPAPVARVAARPRRRRSARASRGACRAGWDGSPPARPRPS